MALADDQAGVTGQPGAVKRLVIVTDAASAVRPLNKPNSQFIIDYIVLDVPADPAIAAIADNVWKLAQKPGPAAAEVRPLREGLKAFMQSINDKCRLSDIKDNNSGFSLRVPPYQQVKKSAVVVAGNSPSITKKGAARTEPLWQSGAFAIAIPSAAGEYTLGGATVVFAAEWREWSSAALGIGAVLVIVVGVFLVFLAQKGITAIASWNRATREPAFEVKMKKNGKGFKFPVLVYIRKVPKGKHGFVSGARIKEIIREIASSTNLDEKLCAGVSDQYPYLEYDETKKEWIVQYAPAMKAQVIFSIEDDVSADSNDTGEEDILAAMEARMAGINSQSNGDMDTTGKDKEADTGCTGPVPVVFVNNCFQIKNIFKEEYEIFLEKKGS